MDIERKDIKGELFNRGVPDRTFDTVETKPRFKKEDNMFKKLLKTVTKPFRSKPSVNLSTENINDQYMSVLVSVEWWVLNLEVTVTYHVELKKFSVLVTVEGAKVFEESVKL